MILFVAAAVFLAGYAVLISFYRRQWQRLKTYEPIVPGTCLVSVIIAARNEEENLPLLVSDLQKQDYPGTLFEVIVVDDYSTDNTAAAVAETPSNFRVIRPGVAAEWSNKKQAITSGVAAANGELVVITDADCRVGEKWLSTIASFYQQTGASFIAAPVKYSYKNTPLQILQVLDFLTLQGITGASVSARVHSMCNGANLAYTKAAFEAVNGFAGIDRVPTGDDMLLMHKIWKHHPAGTFYLKSREATVCTPALPSWKAFLQQRRRWASKTLVYDDKRILVVLAFVLLLNLLPFGLLLSSFVRSSAIYTLLFFILGKSLVEAPFVLTVARFFGQQKLLCYFFFLQPVHVFYTVLVGFWSQVGSYTWKGRTSTAIPRREDPSQPFVSEVPVVPKGDKAAGLAAIKEKGLTG